MKIVVISDTHSLHNQLLIPECDLLLHAGDFTAHGHIPEANIFAHWFAKQPAKYKVAIPGNHDFCCEAQPALIKEIFTNLGCHLLIDNMITLDGLNIYGSPYQPWFYDWAFNFPSEEPEKSLQAKRKWSQIPDETNILLVHGPPYKCLDRVNTKGINEEWNVGCKHLLERIKQLSDLKLVATGHIHEARGSMMLNNTHIINAACASLGSSFSKLRPPFHINL